MVSNGALMVRDEAEAKLLEQVVVGGDLSKLSPAQRLDYYRRTCESLGLNPLTKPFDYINLSGKLTLYARKDCTEQLRSNRGVSISIAARDLHENIGVYAVTAKATADGRTDESIGAVNIKGLTGEALANALMKAETKAKRRVTLSICGLGMLDETEASTIPDARPVQVDEETGEILSAPSTPAYPSSTAARPTQAPATPSSGGAICTEKQRKMIYAVAKDNDLSKDLMKSILQERYQVDDSRKLTKQQASDLITFLKEAPTVNIPADLDRMEQGQ